jgi:hypothetical protein
MEKVKNEKREFPPCMAFISLMIHKYKFFLEKREENIHAPHMHPILQIPSSKRM